MSLVDGLRSPHTPLRRFLDRELSASPRPLRDSYRAQHRADHVLLPPPGYALLDTTAKASRASGTFRRRVFWVLPHDRDSQPDGLYAKSAPAEAVDPRTLEPRVKGHKTERSEGGPPSAAMKELGITLPL